MGSRTYLLFGLCLAIALLVISDVSARDLAETSSEKDNVAATIDGHGGGGGGCRHGWCGNHCCYDAAEAVDAEENNVADTESKYQGGGGWHQGGGGGGGWHQGGGGGGGWHQGGGGGGGWHQGGGGGGGGGCRRWCGRHCC